jgi:hypothetical protein
MSTPHTTSASQRTFEDGRQFWRARDAYRVASLLSGFLCTVFLIEGVLFLCTGQWHIGLVASGITLLLGWGGVGGVRHGARRARTWWRTRRDGHA